MILVTFIVPFSAFIMLAIAIDRFFCICDPFLQASNLWRAKLMILCLLARACICRLITVLSHGIIPPVETASQTNLSANISSALLAANATKPGLLNVMTLVDQRDKHMTSLKASNACEYNIKWYLSEAS